MFRTSTSAALLAFCGAVVALGQSDQQRLDELTSQIRTLQSGVAQPKTVQKPKRPVGVAQSEDVRDRNRARYQVRVQKERVKQSVAESVELERLFLAANNRRTPGRLERLKQFVAAYPGTNRAGCAYLYMAQLSAGGEKERFLKTAIADYSDSWYSNGVQVGANARFELAFHYRETARDEEARRLCAEVRKDYPEAVNHGGRLLISIIAE